MLSLDAAGKTAILYRLKLGKPVTVIPTIGINVETIKINGFNINIQDVGGGDRIRNLWHHYFTDKQALIFVVDSNDVARIDEARDELHNILRKSEVQNVVLLVFANKQDLPNAIKPQELANQLKIDTITDRP